MKKIITAIFIMLGMSTSIYAQQSAEAVQTQITQKQALLIDVRTQGEFEQGHLENAVLMPYDVIETGISTLTEDKDQLIYVYCRSGNRSGAAKTTLERLGFTNVQNLGGYEQLKAAGLK